MQYRLLLLALLAYEEEGLCNKMRKFSEILAKRRCHLGNNPFDLFFNHPTLSWP